MKTINNSYLSFFWAVLIALQISGAAVSCFAETVHEGLLGTSLPGDFIAFAPNSPWNTPIVKDPPLAPSSAQMIEHLSKKAKRLKMDSRQWSIPLFVIDSGRSPLRQVLSSKPLHPSLDADGDGIVPLIPLPDGIWPDPKKDGHLLLVDPLRRLSWDLARASKLPDGNWKASRIARWDLNGPGYEPAFTGKRWWTRGARGSGMPLIAGLVRPEEIASGEIRHALATATPINRRSMISGGPLQLCAPTASRSDGTYDGAMYIPLGARLQLDPNLDIDRLGLSSATKVIARAMQRYGLYNSDGSKTFKLYFQNLGEQDHRWQQFGSFDDLAKIPLASFRVLSCHYSTKMIKQ